MRQETRDILRRITADEYNPKDDNITIPIIIIIIIIIIITTILTVITRARLTPFVSWKNGTPRQKISRRLVSPRGFRNSMGSPSW